MDGVKIVLCAIGAFYAFAGHVATRAALTSHFVDRAIAAIEGKRPSRVETVQSYWLLSAAALVLASGVALLFLLDVAAWLFLASAMGQALYLFCLAPLLFDVADPPEAGGRRGSVNAFVVYAAATALVVWAVARGELESWQDVAWPWLALPAAVVGAHVGYVVWTIARAPAAPAFALPQGALRLAAEKANGDPSRSTRIKVMADVGTNPLWALDDNLDGDFPPDRLDLSPELTRDLNEWAEAFASAPDPDDPDVSRWSDAQHKAHDARGWALAARLAREKPDRIIYVVDAQSGDLVEVAPDDGDWN